MIACYLHTFIYDMVLIRVTWQEEMGLFYAYCRHLWCVILYIYIKCTKLHPQNTLCVTMSTECHSVTFMRA